MCVLTPDSVPSSRRAVVARSTTPLLAEKAVQLVPLLVLYCHAPLVLSTVVTAMATTAAPSASDRLAVAIRLAIESPAEVMLFSTMAVSAGE